MEKQQISKKEILEMPVFNLIFSRKEYTDFTEEFIYELNKGKAIDPKRVLYLMIEAYCVNCGISKGYRTVFYDFGGSFLGNHPELWNEKDKKNTYAFVSLCSYFKTFYPEYDNKLDEYDVAVMQYWQYLEYSLDLLLNGDINGELKQAFCYCMYLFFIQMLDDYSQEMIEKEIEEIKSKFNRIKQEREVNND